MRVAIEPWTDADLTILQRSNTPEMMRYLGGPESDEKLLDRHRRYVEGNGMFRVVLLPDRAVVGSTGFWEKIWLGDDVYETGWAVLPEYQGRGIAAVAVRAVAARAAADGTRRYLHAYPSLDNGPSNAVCRKAGFEFLGEYDFEYPPGHTLRCNDWRLDLNAFR
ncbi:MAG TPA: GNAT family N-acetyltransferase [Jatrophihabitantaceae bacterium]|jgi:RimJ/RimL family protein N-acetyltransferase